MTKEEIGQMAEQAGIKKCDCDPNCYLSICGMGSLTYFAKLVAAAEREACAVIAFNAKTYIAVADAIRARGQDV